jgi:hypothetical protein
MPRLLGKSPFAAVLALAVSAAACGDNLTDDQPVVVGAALATDEDVAVVHTVEAIDPEGRMLTLSAGAAERGTVAVAGLQLTYTPAANFAGSDSFLITISNGLREATARVTVTVRPINDAPTVVGEALAAIEDMALVRTHAALLANDTDVDGDRLTLVAVGGAMNGAAARSATDVTFTPAANYAGPARFTYTVSDGSVQVVGTVTLDVGGENDPPVATDDASATAEDTAVVITAAALLANDADAEGQTLTVTQVGGATHGTVALVGATITFTPAASFAGEAAFEYTVSDGSAADVGRVTIAVSAVDDPPIATDDAAATSAGTAISIPAADLLANDVDLDGPGLVITGVQNAIEGTAVLVGDVVRFTPDPGFVGVAGFEYVVTSGAASDVARVIVEVAGPAVP